MQEQSKVWVHEARTHAARARQLADAATAGPWYVRNADDAFFMNAYYVTNREGASDISVDAWDHPNAVVAITLLQEPSLAVPEEYEENTYFIASARTDVPRLCDALDRALKDRAALADAVRQLLVTTEMPGGAIEYGEAMELAQRLLDELDEG
jgi:hypothetical protein